VGEHAERKAGMRGADKTVSVSLRRQAAASVHGLRLQRAGSRVHRAYRRRVTGWITMSVSTAGQPSGLCMRMHSAGTEGGERSARVELSTYGGQGRGGAIERGTLIHSALMGMVRCAVTGSDVV
jgi:hypothetical protein